jgi:hypothetical protein
MEQIRMIPHDSGVDYRDHDGLIGFAISIDQTPRLAYRDGGKVPLRHIVRVVRNNRVGFDRYGR